MRTSDQYPNRCGNCGDPITPDGTLHVWSGRVGMPDHPYDHPAQKRPPELEKCGRTGDRPCGRIGCCVPLHDFVRHESPHFGELLGGGCGAQHGGVTCGWPEPAHARSDTRPNPPGGAA